MPAGRVDREGGFQVVPAGLDVGARLRKSIPGGRHIVIPPLELSQELEGRDDPGDDGRGAERLDEKTDGRPDRLVGPGSRQIQDYFQGVETRKTLRAPLLNRGFS